MTDVIASKPRGVSGKRRAKQEVREDVILDAAAELIQRWGYNKTTVDDIARKAGVAKGTIYLHWKTRDELFQALMDRETRVITEDIQQRITGDPDGATIHGSMKHSLLATAQYPLMKAVLLRDADMLGKWGRKQEHTGAYERRLAGYTALLDLARKAGLVRADMEMREQLYLLSVLSIGMLIADAWLPDEVKLSDEQAVNVISETVKRTLETPSSTKEEWTVVSQAFNKYMEQVVLDLAIDQNMEDTEE
ncbi:MAG TPA: helix-turn-helix domain-containing protein [Chloroflexia bacterium]|nr:helix-turn-helix domain-containing protein [Chloroflexia bacterium]